MSKQELLRKYENEIKEFEEWIQTQSRLPKNIGKSIKFLINIFKCFYNYTQRMFSHKSDK